MQRKERLGVWMKDKGWLLQLTPKEHHESTHLELLSLAVVWRDIYLLYIG
ncbi:hypothetical protein COCNU_06G018890 [Cocos nucifera]|uniref:Uncharacterized protein n=1 Tax=Cocos nucifera TaxID=13894 RepID=A0A8K0IDJ0_COCNU|nr:hypothetical protein COCNU_06G018890 [Cocos nucifera]